MRVGGDGGFAEDVDERRGAQPDAGAAQGGQLPLADGDHGAAALGEGRQGAEVVQVVGVGAAVEEFLEEGHDTHRRVGVDGRARLGQVEGGAGLRVQGVEDPPVLGRVGHMAEEQSGPAVRLGERRTGLQHRAGRTGLDQPARTVQHARPLGHVQVVEDDERVGVQGNGVQPALPLGPFPQRRREVLAGDAELGQQLQVEGVEQSAGRVPRHPRQMEHRDIRRPAAGGGHGQLGVVGRSPLQDGAVQGEAVGSAADGVHHLVHQQPVAAGEQIPDLQSHTVAAGCGGDAAGEQAGGECRSGGGQGEPKKPPAVHREPVVAPGMCTGHLTPLGPDAGLFRSFYIDVQRL